MKTAIFCALLALLSGLLLLACGPSAEDDTPTGFPLDDNDNDGDSYSELDGDCDDTNPTKHPQAPEVCDGKDDDCDGLIDDGLLSTWYVDSDGDGYGDPNGTAQACALPPGYSPTSGDCNDGDPSSNPDGVEVCGGGDNDCDTVVDEGVDEDGDGRSTCTDCDDHDEYVHDLSPEYCDAKDNDCDGGVDEDFDLDGDGWPNCADGFRDIDCNDNNPNMHPGTSEVCGTGLDEDCSNGVDDTQGDKDGDGWPSCVPIPHDIDDTCTPEICSDCVDNFAVTYPGSPNEGSDCDGIQELPAAL